MAAVNLVAFDYNFSLPIFENYKTFFCSMLQLHLNPVHAVMQFRPLMSHIDPSGLQKRKHVSQKTGIVTSDDEEVQESAKPSTSRVRFGKR